MLSSLRKYRYDFLLALTYAIMVWAVHYYYPVPQISWDSNYYVQKSWEEIPGIRPAGYSFFLGILYDIKPELPFIAWAQYCIYFVSIYTLLVTVRYTMNVRGFLFYILGVLLLIEPAGLYHCFNVLSDVLFSSLSHLYIATLILFLFKRNVIYFLLHLLFIYCCIETRHVALFYPFFSAAVILLFSNLNYFFRIVCIVSTLFVYNYVIKLNVEKNEKEFRVPVHSAFSGWTFTNNALYALPRIHMEAKTIVDPQIRELHHFFKTYMDTTSFTVQDVGSGFIWDERSPMRVYRRKVEDSLRAINANSEFFATMFVTAPAFHKYGMFIHKNFPYEFLMGFVVPNISTLVTPHDGEMMDYYVAPSMSDTAMRRYKIKPEYLYCNRQIYKDHINAINLKAYHIRLALFAISAGLIVYFRKKINRRRLLFFGVLAGFVVIFYLLTLVTSWFLPRYLLPVLPLMTIITTLAASLIFDKNKDKEPGVIQ